MAGSPKTRFSELFSQDSLMFLGTPSRIRTVPGGWPARRSEADYGFLADVRLPFACRAPGSGVVAFSVSIVFVLIVFLLDRVAVVTLIALVMKNIKAILQDSSRAGNTPSSIRGIGGCGAFFFYPTKTLESDGESCSRYAAPTGSACRGARARPPRIENVRAASHKWSAGENLRCEC